MWLTLTRFHLTFDCRIETSSSCCGTLGSHPAGCEAAPPPSAPGLTTVSDTTSREPSSVLQACAKAHVAGKNGSL